jgi:hypothetical protein
VNARRGSVRRVTRVWTAALLLAGVGAVMTLSAGSAAAATGCQLGPGGSIKHVIIVQFDNVHLARDNANVPSDIEQIPALYNFMRDNGTLLANDHTVLISRAPVSSWEARYLIGRADRLIGDAKFLAGSSAPPRFTVCS